MVEGIFIVKAAAFIGAGLAMAVGSIGPALGQGMIGQKSCESIGKYPESSNKVQLNMIIALAFVETSALYAFIIAILLIIFNR